MIGVGIDVTNAVRRPISVSSTGDPDVSSFSITGSAPAATEGNSGAKTFAFTITRTGGLTYGAAVDWAVTGNGSNPANAADFVGGVFPSGTANFAANAATATINVQVQGDTTVEPDEGFVVTLSNPRTTGAIGTGTGTSTILNDDVSVGGTAYDIILVAADSYGSGIYARDAGDTLGTLVSQFNSNASDPHYRTITKDLPLSQPVAPTGTSYLSIAEPFANTHATRTGNPTLIVPYSWPGTSLLSSGHVWQVGDTLHEGAVAQANAAIAAAQAVYPNSKLVAIALLDSGLVNDASVATATKANIAAMLPTVVNDFRSRITGAATVPVIFQSFLPELIAANNIAGPPHLAQRDYNDSIREFAAVTPHVYFVNVPVGYSGDNVHLSNAGLRVVGPMLDAIMVDTTAPVITAPSTYAVYDAQPINIPLAADKYVSWSTSTAGWEIVRTFGTGGANGINTVTESYTLRLTGNANASHSSPPANPTVVARDGAGNLSNKTIATSVLAAYGSVPSGANPITANFMSVQDFPQNADLTTLPVQAFGAGLNLIYVESSGGGTTPFTSLTVNGIAATLVKNDAGATCSQMWSVPIAQAGNYSPVIVPSGPMNGGFVEVMCLTNTVATASASDTVPVAYRNSPTNGASLTCPASGIIVGMGFAQPALSGGSGTTLISSNSEGEFTASRTTTGAISIIGVDGYSALISAAFAKA